MSGFEWSLFLAYTTISFLLDVSAILLNVIVAYVLKKYKKIRIITFWFIYCLSISDALVGLTGLVYHSLLIKRRLDSGKSSRSLTATSVTLHHSFCETSGQLILIIAIDRYIHMKYLRKYCTIVTKSRARVGVLFCIVFGIAVIIPNYALPAKSRAAYNLCMNMIRATGALFICVIYITTYFKIRRQFAALQLSERSTITPFSKPDKKGEYQSKQSIAQHCNGSLQSNFDVTSDSLTAPNRYQSCAIAKGDLSLRPQSKVSIFPESSGNSSAKVTANREKPNVTETTTNISHVVGDGTSFQATGMNLGCGKAMESRQATNTEGQKVCVHHKWSLRSATPERNSLKAIMFIVLTLLICYMPYFFNKFYTFVTKDKNKIMEAASFVAVLLNSSLNAIILIAFNKEMQRNIKAIFAKE